MIAEGAVATQALDAGAADDRLRSRVMFSREAAGCYEYIYDVTPPLMLMLINDTNSDRQCPS